MSESTSNLHSYWRNLSVIAKPYLGPCLSSIFLIINVWQDPQHASEKTNFSAQITLSFLFIYFLLVTFVYIFWSVTWYILQMGDHTYVSVLILVISFPVKNKILLQIKILIIYLPDKWMYSFLTHLYCF